MDILLSTEQIVDNDFVKIAILKAIQLVPEAYMQKCRNLGKQ